MSAQTRHDFFRVRLLRYLCQAEGFTLIELLVVIVIAGILTAIAIPTLLNQMRRSRIAEASSALTATMRGSEVYRLDIGVFPLDYSDIAAFGPGSASRYMNDPWSAANFQEPQFGSGAGGSAQMGIAAQGQGAPYVNQGDGPLICAIGLAGAERPFAESDFYYSDFCNLYCTGTSYTATDVADDPTIGC